MDKNSSRYSFSHASSIFFYNKNPHPSYIPDEKNEHADESDVTTPTLTKTIQFTRKRIMIYLVIIVLIISGSLIAIIVAFTTKSSHAAAEKFIEEPAVVKTPSIENDPKNAPIQPPSPLTNGLNSPLPAPPPTSSEAESPPPASLPPLSPPPLSASPPPPTSPVLNGTVKLFDEVNKGGNSIIIPLELNRCNSNLLGFDNRALSANYDGIPLSNGNLYYICYYSEQSCTGRSNCWKVNADSERIANFGPQNFALDAVGGKDISSLIYTSTRAA